MPKTTVASLLDPLEGHYGAQKPTWPTDPYEFLIWWHCGYPQSDARCSRGWESLTKVVSIDPPSLLAATPAKLSEALKPGGMVPELRAQRLKEIAYRVQNEFAGDLRTALRGPVASVRSTLKKFPNIADPGADRILLFGGISPVAAVPSNCPHVLVRILHGQERENYGVNYREAQEAITAETSAEFASRQRAYLLLKTHGQTLCKAKKPKCEVCPIQASCAYAAKLTRGSAPLAKKAGSRR